MIALIDYGAGNTASVSNALTALGIEHKLTKVEMEICNAEKIILPGVGEASFAMKKLHLYNLFNLLRIIKIPILGICLGMQLFAEKSEEGNVACLGHIPCDVKMFDPKKAKVPHMGWNKVSKIEGSKLFDGIEDQKYFYFAHSYYLPENEFMSSKTEHGETICASIEKDNIYGVQFHPEKSGELGLQILKNFKEKC